MGIKTSTITRKSIFYFLQNYQYLTSNPSLLVFPFAVSSLLSQSLISSSYLFPFIQDRMSSIFLAAGFPPSSELFQILSLKLSQTILTFLFLSPFTYFSLLLSKASIIHELANKDEFSSSWTTLLKPLITTQLCNSLVILAANATCFFLIALLFNCFYVLGLSSPQTLLLISATGAVIYSIILANAYIVCNLALVSSGMEKNGGFTSILKACVLIQGRAKTALSLAVFINIALVAVEGLFQYRIMGAHNNKRYNAPNSVMVMEAMFIAYLYALLLVLDTVIGCVFWRSCSKDYCRSDQGEIIAREGKCFAEMEKVDLLL